MHHLFASRPCRCPRGVVGFDVRGKVAVVAGDLILAPLLAGGVGPGAAIPDVPDTACDVQGIQMALARWDQQSIERHSLDTAAHKFQCRDLLWSKVGMSEDR